MALIVSRGANKEKKGSDELIASVAYKEEGAGLGSFDLLDLGFCERMMRESNAMAFWTELVERRGVFAAYWGTAQHTPNTPASACTVVLTAVLW